MKNVITFATVLLILSGSLFAQVRGSALLFDGVDNYVNFGNSPVFDIDSAVTYEVWIRPDTGQSGFIFNKWVNFQEDKQLVYSAEHIYFYLFNTFAGASLQSSSVIPLHEFTHIAATYNGTKAEIYVNGVLDTMKDVISGVSNSSGSLYMGFNADRFDVIDPFMGAIDEFRIWNTVLSDSEIQATMNQPLTGNEPGLIGCWDFDEGTGTTTTDKTMNGNDGTISGATWLNPTENMNETVSIRSFNISQNYPNPFNPSTSITYNLPYECNVEISVTNAIGEKVKELINEHESGGEHTINFYAGSLASGIYLYRIRAASINGSANFVSTKKMLLLK